MTKGQKDYPLDRLSSLRDGARFMQSFSMRETYVLVHAKMQPMQECTVRGLAAKLDCPKPAITRALDALSEANLVTREKDPLDARSILFRLTEDGERLVTTLNTVMS